MNVQHTRCIHASLKRPLFHQAAEDQILFLSWFIITELCTYKYVTQLTCWMLLTAVNEVAFPVVNPTASLRAWLTPKLALVSCREPALTNTATDETPDPLSRLWTATPLGNWVLWRNDNDMYVNTEYYRVLFLYVVKTSFFEELKTFTRRFNFQGLYHFYLWLSSFSLLNCGDLSGKSTVSWCNSRCNSRRHDVRRPGSKWAPQAKKEAKLAKDLTSLLKTMSPR